MKINVHPVSYTHLGILDVDTEELIDIARGDIVTSKIVSIVKGEKGKPGELQGSIDNGKIIGEVYKNTHFGIYGKINNVEELNQDSDKVMEVMARDEVKEVKASILCTLDDNKQEEYEIEIEKVYTSTNRSNKNMIIKVTDQRLLEKTCLLYTSFPILLLMFQKKMRQMEMENEVMQFQTIILMLMRIERVNVEMILEWLERYSNIFKEPISKCVNNYEAGAWEALEQLKEDISYQDMIRIVESLQAAVEKIPIVEAFDELDTERDYYQAKRI